MLMRQTPFISTFQRFISRFHAFFFSPVPRSFLLPRLLESATAHKAKQPPFYLTTPSATGKEVLRISSHRHDDQEEDKL